MYKIENEDIAIRTLADHFGKTYEAMRQLKRKWDSEKSGLWIVYVKAYNWDNGGGDAFRERELRKAREEKK